MKRKRGERELVVAIVAAIHTICLPSNVAVAQCIADFLPGVVCKTTSSTKCK